MDASIAKKLAFRFRRDFTPEEIGLLASDPAVLPDLDQRRRGYLVAYLRARMDRRHAALVHISLVALAAVSLPLGWLLERALCPDRWRPEILSVGGVNGPQAVAWAVAIFSIVPGLWAVWPYAAAWLGRQMKRAGLA